MSTKEDTDPTCWPRSLEWESKRPALKLREYGKGVAPRMERSLLAWCSVPKGMMGR